MPKQLRERVIKENPTQFNHSGIIMPNPVGAVGSAQRQCHQRRESQNPILERMPERFRYRITLISCRKRMVDSHDNIRTGTKPLIDRITEWLGFKSDSDSRLEWCYEQIKTEGTPGTIVLIERKLL